MGKPERLIWCFIVFYIMGTKTNQSRSETNNRLILSVGIWRSQFHAHVIWAFWECNLNSPNFFYFYVLSFADNFFSFTLVWIWTEILVQINLSICLSVFWCFLPPSFVPKWKWTSCSIDDLHACMLWKKNLKFAPAFKINIRILSPFHFFHACHFNSKFQ